MEGQGLSPTGWHILEIILTNVASFVVFIFLLNRQVVKLTENLDALTNWMKAHELSDKERFDGTKEDLTKESSRFERKLDEHIKDRKDESRSLNIKLDTITNSITDVRVKLAESNVSRKES